MGILTGNDEHAGSEGDRAAEVAGSEVDWASEAAGSETGRASEDATQSMDATTARSMNSAGEHSSANTITESRRGYGRRRKHGRYSSTVDSHGRNSAASDSHGRRSDAIKSRQRSLPRILLILLCPILLLALAAAVTCCLHYQHTAATRPADHSTVTIAQFHSTVDQDSDGIDDQTDILQGALDYVATKPKYKSEYYADGWPDDGYGVCTDVVGAALLAAGYDLKTLVQEDIAAHPDTYDITEPDPNIDFRRVANLRVWLQNNAISLTTDLTDTEAWQGGDIVVFTHHIGVISDRRNSDGVPYVIHHNDPMQTSYEQDILEKRSDIVGHFRISE